MPSRPPRRVLVIEDNVDAANTLREVLELGEHEIEVAFNGPEGLMKAREFKPEVVLCDIGMPGMDGYAVAKAKEAGFDQHLAKPFSLEELEQVFALTPAAGDVR
jgi:CheY-like chemotaxis protein